MAQGIRYLECASADTVNGGGSIIRGKLESGGRGGCFMLEMEDGFRGRWESHLLSFKFTQHLLFREGCHFTYQRDAVYALDLHPASNS